MTCNVAQRCGYFHTIASLVNRTRKSNLPVFHFVIFLIKKEKMDDAAAIRKTSPYPFLIFAEDESDVLSYGNLTMKIQTCFRHTDSSVTFPFPFSDRKTMNISKAWSDTLLGLNIKMFDQLARSGPRENRSYLPIFTFLDAAATEFLASNPNTVLGLFRGDGKTPFHERLCLAKLFNNGYMNVIKGLMPCGGIEYEYILLMYILSTKMTVPIVSNESSTNTIAKCDDMELGHVFSVLRRTGKYVGKYLKSFLNHLITAAHYFKGIWKDEKGMINRLTYVLPAVPEKETE